MFEVVHYAPCEVAVFELHSVPIFEDGRPSLQTTSIEYPAVHPFIAEGKPPPPACDFEDAADGGKRSHVLYNIKTFLVKIHYLTISSVLL